MADIDTIRWPLKMVITSARDFAWQSVARWNPWETMTRTIELPLPDELLRLLDEKAKAAGLEREAYIRAVLSKDVSDGPSIDEILAPFRNQVTASGLSDDQLDRLFGEAREEVHKPRST